MKTKSNTVIKAGFWYTISNFIVKSLTFISMPIFTRLMTKADIGNFSNIMSWFNILAIITTFELYSSINLARFDYKEELSSYISSSLFLGSLITMIFYIVVIVFQDFFSDFFGMNKMTMNLIFIYLLVYPAIQMFQIKNQINYNYKSTVFVSLTSSFISLGTSIILVLVLQNKLNGRILGYFLPLILFAVIVYLKLIIEGKCISKKYWKYSLKISFPLIWHLLAWYLLSSSDRIMITKLISSEANALYSVAYSLTSIAGILWTSMNNAWSSWAYSKMDKKEFDKLFNYSKPYLFFYVIFVITMILFSPELLLIMGGKYYVQAKYVIPPVMIGFIFQFIYSLYVNIEFYHKKQKNIAIGTIFAATINILLNLIFIPKFGYIAAAYTTLTGYVFLFLIHYLFVKKLKCTWWYDTKFFMKVIVISLLAIPITCILFKLNIIRYILISIISIIIIIFIIVNKEKFIQAIKTKNFTLIIDLLKRKKEV